MKTKKLYVCMNEVIQTMSVKDPETQEKREASVFGCFGYLSVHETEKEIIDIFGDEAAIMTIEVPAEG